MADKTGAGEENGKLIVRKSKKGKFYYKAKINGKTILSIPIIDKDVFEVGTYDAVFIRKNGPVVHVEAGTHIFPRRVKKSDMDLFDIKKTALPDYIKEKYPDIPVDNFHIKYNRAPVYIDREKDRIKNFKTEIKDRVVIKKTVNFDFTSMKDTIEAVYENQRNNVALLAENYAGKQRTLEKTLIGFELKTDAPLTIGSNENVYESSIALHHLYGFPYIPATGIKGALRDYIIGRYFNFDEGIALKDDFFKTLFGETSHRAALMMFDAFPSTPPEIHYDVQNPHHGGSGKEPKNFERLIPSFFITCKNTEFWFHALLTKDLQGKFDTFKNQEQVDNTEVYGFVRDTLNTVLVEMGLGKKTSVGYGRFASKVDNP